MLRLAATGTAAADVWHSEADLALLKEHGVRRGYELPDLGWPDPPTADAA